MAKLLAEEPDALLRARPGLWEPWRVTAKATRPERTKKKPFRPAVCATSAGWRYATEPKNGRYFGLLRIIWGDSRCREWTFSDTFFGVLSYTPYSGHVVMDYLPRAARLHRVTRHSDQPIRRRRRSGRE
jgi:hypothetical protein